MTTRTSKITVDEFWAMAADPGHRYELVDGELVDMDGAPPHGRLTGHIYMLIFGQVAERDLPLDVGVTTGFAMGAHTLRFPDVHVTTWERMAEYDEEAGGWPHFAPDVAIEVVSPSNTTAGLNRKASEYFANGSRAMWIADPGPLTVTVRRPGAAEQVFGVGDILSGEPEIPGFSCPVADIFAVLDRRAASATDAAQSGRP
jgi:Uma2 family endonuclease